MAAQGKRADLKAFLMDQTIVCGLGNIYVCETLYRARLSPLKPAARIATPTGRPKPAADRLVPHIQRRLGRSDRRRRFDLARLPATDGSLGYFQHRFAVYGREGEPCLTPGCTSTIKRIVQANRSTFYCPTCQRG